MIHADSPSPRFLHRRVMVAIASALVAASAAAQYPPVLTDLGALPGGTATYAHDVSADGQVVAGSSGLAFRWTIGEGMTSLGTLPGFDSSVSAAASGDGSVIVGVSWDSSFHDSGPYYPSFASRWTSSTGMVSLGTLSGDTVSWSNGVSGDGLVTVGGSAWTEQDEVGFPRAFRWTTAGRMVALGEGVANATNEDGSVVVGWAESGAFRWTSGGGMVPIGPFPDGAFSSAAAVSSDGSVIVGSSRSFGSESRAFRWTASAGPLELGALSASGSSEAEAISKDGWVVAGQGSIPDWPYSHAWLWIGAPGMVDLNTYLPWVGVDLSGWVLTDACGLNSDGSVIVGNGYHDGEYRAWRVEIPRPHIATVSVCFGDGSETPCPCGNTGLPGHGCDNSNATGGALLSASGEPSLSADTLRLTASNERLSAPSLFWQGRETSARVFGDGIGCMGAPLERLFFHTAVGGVVSAPQGADLTISAGSAALGDPIVPGTTRVYHVFYRDPIASFCDWPRGSSFNVTNGLRVLWRE